MSVYLTSNRLSRYFIKTTVQHEIAFSQCHTLGDYVNEWMNILCWWCFASAARELIYQSKKLNRHSLNIGQWYRREDWENQMGKPKLTEDEFEYEFGVCQYHQARESPDSTSWNTIPVLTEMKAVEQLEKQSLSFGLLNWYLTKYCHCHIHKRYLLIIWSDYENCDK